jgi:nitroreductase
MDINVAISGRRSVREYTSQPVDEATIRRLIDAAVLAPSAVNQQPWSFTVVRDQALLDRATRTSRYSITLRR